MRFTFLHAADLHLGSPLAALGQKDKNVAERFAKAGLIAVERMVDQAIADQSAFLLLAGDIYDGEWKDASAGLFFTRAMARLNAANIPVYLIKGNHDADSQVARSLPLPANVHVFSTKKAETKHVEGLPVVIHGRSFSKQHPDETFIHTYPAPTPNVLNIGLLHTSLDGRGGTSHLSYAPCDVETLKKFGYDYWALGHIHQQQIVADNPWIVFPGNIQGRHIRETGPKGVMRVTVDDGRITKVEPLASDAARWAHETIDITTCADKSATLNHVKARLGALHAQGEERPMAVRLRLTGQTPLHSAFMATKHELKDDFQALTFEFGDDIWIERVVLATNPPPQKTRTTEGDALDIPALLDATQTDPDFHTTLDSAITALADKLPPDMIKTLFENEGAMRENIIARAHALLLGTLNPEGEA